MEPHRLAEARSLAYHRLVAERLDEALLETAKRRVATWMAEGRSLHYASQWQSLLDGPRTRLVEILTQDSEEARALRQATPFAGVLSPRERWKLWARVKKEFEHESRSA